MSDKLPSIDDLPKSNLPSFDEFITEEKELPSIDEFVEKEEEEIVEEVEEEEIVVDTQDLTEIVRLINDVRKDIPNIPEIKYYDEELERLTEQIEEVRGSIPEPPEIPEIKYYDDEIASLREEIDRNAADIPEIKYYDEQVNDLEDKINVIKEAIVSLPEPKYYEADLESLKEDILAVKESIPVFPKWVNEVNEVPDFSWIGKTFGVIDSDFVKVEDKLSSIRDRIDQEVKHIFEEIDVKEFESKNSLDELTTNFNTTKDKIYKELREAALRIHDTKHSFRNDDRLLKKDILSKFNVLKQRVDEEVKEFNRKNIETKDIFDGYFTALTEEIANLPEVKYYDEDVDKLKEDIKSTSSNISELYKIVDELKGKQEVLKEELVNDRPITPDPEEKQGKDPLTPTDQQFATLKDLAANYRLFVNRVEQQLYTIGGGGAGFLKDMSDVNIRTGITTGDLLIYGGGSSGQDWVGIASTALVTGGGTGYFVQNSTGIHTTSNVGIGTTTASDALTILGDVNVNGVVTAVNGYFSGILTAHTFEKHEVTDIYSTGIITATKGIQITTLGLNIASGVATLTDGLRVGSAATIYSNGNATFSGIVTASSFVGDGTGLTGVASTDNIQTATPARFLSNIYNSGISTFVGLSSFQGGVNVKAGSANTSLMVEGDARFTGVTTFSEDVYLDNRNIVWGDSNNVNNDRAAFGAGLDLYIFHNGTDSHIDNNTGNLIIRNNVTSDVGGNIKIQPKPNEDGIIITHDGSVALYHDDSKILETSTSGITVTGQTSSSTGFVVGTAATISANGNATFSGIVTATSFVGDGSGLSGITAITINNNADNRLITGSGSANTLNGESTLTYDGTALSVSTGATVFTNGNIAAAGIVTANGGFVGSGANITTINGSNISSGTVAAARVATLNQDTTGTADNITVTANNSADETVYPIFVDGATGSQGAESDTGLTYNPSDGNLTATTFTGALTGNVTGNASGSSGSCTGDAAGLTGTPNITVGSVTATTGAYSGDVTLTNTGTDSSAGPIINLYRNSSSPADADYLGQIKFQGENDNDEQINYAKITGKISDASDSSEDGILEFAFIKAGSQNINARFKSTELQLINGTNFSVAGESTFTGNIIANGDIDLEGDIDVNGTCEADAYTVAGTALDTHIAGVTVTNATNSSHVLVTDNESTDENNLITFVEGATSSTGNVGLEMDGNLTYNPNSGTLTATVFSGSGASLTNIPGIASESDTAVSSTSATSVLSFAHASYRSASLLLQITQGSAYQSGRYMVIHDGTTATILEESAVATGSMLGTFTAGIDGANLKVYVNMGSASSATVTVLATQITV